MYLSARVWGIQPGEFWDMTLGEYMAEAAFQAQKTPEGRAAAKRDDWLKDAELSDEEWKAKHGSPQN